MAGVYSEECHLLDRWCYNSLVSQTAHLGAGLFTMNLVGFIAIAVMNTTQTLIIDLLPAQSSSVTACVRIFLIHPLRSN